MSTERVRRHLELSELVNRILDRGVVIAGDVTISVADIDLIRLGLVVTISSVEAMEGPPKAADADLPVRPRRAGG